MVSLGPVTSIKISVFLILEVACLLIDSCTIASFLVMILFNHCRCKLEAYSHEKYSPLGHKEDSEKGTEDRITL